MTDVGGCVNRLIMWLYRALLIAAPAVLLFVPGSAHALGVDIACDSSDPSCTEIEMSSSGDGQWDVSLEGEKSSTFGASTDGWRRGWWRRFFWRRWPRRPRPGPVEDPIDPTPDPVPEPGTLGLMGLGVAFVAHRMRKRNS
ncbi:MAG: PEP-CTERM sorting domain-containing protein [Myxococcota bacterium]